MSERECICMMQRHLKLLQAAGDEFCGSGQRLPDGEGWVWHSSDSSWSWQLCLAPAVLLMWCSGTSVLCAGPGFGGEGDAGLCQKLLECSPMSDRAKAAAWSCSGYGSAWQGQWQNIWAAVGQSFCTGAAGKERGETMGEAALQSPGCCSRRAGAAPGSRAEAALQPLGHSWQKLCLHGNPGAAGRIWGPGAATLQQPVPKTLNPWAGTHPGAVCEQLQCYSNSFDS